MLMIMLRACVLLSCGFLSFTASADNSVPVNVFSHSPNTAVNTVGRLPSNSSMVTPVNTVNRVPSYTAAVVPVNAVNRVASDSVTTLPNGAANRVFSNTTYSAPANTAHPVAKTVYSVPVNTVNRAPSPVVPTSMVSHSPANILKSAPAINSDNNVVQANDDVWLLIDTKAHKIEVKQGNATIETITGIAIGRRGAGLKHHRGDDITPYGNYQIGWVGERSNFHKFFGLDYPSVQDAEIGLKRGIITERNYYDIVTAHQLHLVPPQNTPLGGKIGIHGIGAGDATVHQLFDWTHGCIALTNQQIDHLSQWIDTGTVVKIR